MKEGLIRIIGAAVLLVAAILIEKNTDWKTWQYLLLYLIPYLILGYDTLWKALCGCLRGQISTRIF